MKHILLTIQFLSGAISFAWACLVIIPQFLNKVRTSLNPRIERSFTTLLLCAAVFVSTSFRFGESPKLSFLPLIVPTVSYGVEHERFDRVETQTFEDDLPIREALQQAGVPAKLRRRSIIEARKEFGTDKLDVSQARMFYAGANKLACVAFPVGPYRYLRVRFDTGEVIIGDQEGVQSEYISTSIFYNGSVDSTLANTLLEEDLQHRIRTAFTCDMPLDTGFKTGVINIVYTVKRNEEGLVLGYGDVEAIRYRVNQQDRTSIRFVDSNFEVEGFFNPDGSPVQQTWLNSPIPGARISSPFNLRRRHPILKRIKPHYGTDYAAPYGTPILAVSDGVVVARDRNKGNGKFVKIRHNDTYQSQYLHMKGFASGVKAGTQVVKGQVIGYVGSTGLSNGPHVCFRFWKNGKQVDHRKELLPTVEELKDESMTAFQEKQAAIQALLDVRA